MTKTTSKNITPDAAGLFYALRSMGYENTAAIADLVDNSIDAHANNIWVTISDDPKSVFIADDGEGMSSEMLHDAITLGRTRAHETEIDLGKYGLGLVTASLSMGKVLRIITKQNGEYNTAVLDYDAIRESNEFTATFRESTDMEKMNFDTRLNDAESGTILIIDKCDKMQYTTAKDFANAVRDSLSEIFHKYIRDGKKIYVNNEAISAYDPLFIDISGVEEIVNRDITINVDEENISEIHVLAVKIPDQGTKINRSMRLNQAGQGFYILRNNREIAAALEFPEIFKKHNDYNLLRIELSFTSDLDDLMGINLKKHDIAPSKEIINKLKGVLDDPIKQYRDDIKAKQKKKRQEQPENPLLPKFPTPPSTPSSATSSGSSQPTITTSPAVTTPADPTPVSSTPTPSQNQEFKFSFLTYVGEPDQPIFKLATAKNATVILYNINNKYYANTIGASSDSTTARQVLDDAIRSSLDAYFALTKSAAETWHFAQSLSENLSQLEPNHD